MKNVRFLITLACLLIFMPAFLFIACPTGGKGLEEIIDITEPDNEPEGPIITGNFTAAPVLTFTGNISDGAVIEDDTIAYRFTAAAPSDDVSYTVYIAEGQHNKSADIIGSYDVNFSRLADQLYFQRVKPGVWYSAVVVAENGNYLAVSGVRQSLGFSGVSFEPGSGALVSLGKSPYPGTRTFYVDYTNGNDSNSGLSPAAPWKNLTKVNNTILRPGDHILLEANSIWNGEPTVNSNFRDFAAARGNGGMLAPQGSGTAERPMVIDLYEYDPASKKAYFSSDRRPVINGNGTPSLDAGSPYQASGAIHLDGQHYWKIRNIEVTNSYDFQAIASNTALRDTHWFKREVKKELIGINVVSNDTVTHCKGILVEYCYAHDVQSLHNNNGNSTGLYTSREFGGSSSGNKGNGGIILCITESTAQYNIVRRVGLEGLRTNHGNWGSRIIFRGNYIETAAGDGMVFSRSNVDNLVESNLIKDACAAPNLGGGNYANNWCYIARNTLYQFNESYGTLYGNLDGEAWDVDNESDQVIYQYNYSHHNVGGACLFMGSQSNSIFRYNISAYDGTGGKWLNTVTDYDMTAVHPDGGAYTYNNYNKGQSLFHYAFGDLSAHVKIPLIHNNTFYIGPGYDVAIFGNTSTSSGVYNKYARFFNNIVLKEGTGEIRLADMHNPGSNQYTLGTLQGSIKNNIFWAPDKNQFKSATANQ
ncbi:MAG: hypothetical protein FWF29_10415, partial [Treponema sp.]|nr:hypothetical protein [Treponema sp.]